MRIIILARTRLHFAEVSMFRHFMLFVCGLVVSTIVLAQPEDEVSASKPASGIGYPTGSAALEALKARSDVSISEEGGWTIVVEEPDIVWAFTPPDHPANPTVVRREIKMRPTFGPVVEMTSLCQAAQEQCDKLLGEFQNLTVQTEKHASGKSKGKPGKAPKHKIYKKLELDDQEQIVPDHQPPPFPGH